MIDEPIYCGTCGKALVIPAWKKRQGNKHFYCSNYCATHNPFRRETFVCQRCGKPFTVPHGRITAEAKRGRPALKYYSRACKDASDSRVTRSCEICGKEFRTWPCEIRKGGGRFCSVACCTVSRRTNIAWMQNLRNKSCQRPNGAETTLASLFPNQIRYTGDGGLWLTMANGHRRNPDFKINDQKKLIEVFGTPYHKKEEEPLIIAEYAEIGWQCMVVWSNHLRPGNQQRALLPRIETFINL
jgi:hypothetical protein